MAHQPNDITPPIEFSGEGQLILYTRYGDPRQMGWTNKWLNEWQVKERFPWFPAPVILIHKHFRPLLEAAFEQLTTTGLYKEIKSCDHCYCLRCITENTEVLSVHSWGAGIDMNSSDNPLGSVGNWSDAFIKIMEDNGIVCGQKWTGRKDPKHFSMVNG